jgi:hypothetical protein
MSYCSTNEGCEKVVYALVKEISKDVYFSRRTSVGECYGLL